MTTITRDYGTISLLALTALSAACSSSHASVPDACEPTCSHADAGNEPMAPGSGGAGAPGIGQGGNAFTSAGGNANLGSGGTSPGGDGGAPTGSGGTSTASGGAAVGNGGTVTSNGSGGTAPTAQYTLQVDVPSSGATVSGSVTVSGWAPGFKNVEVWDGAHTKPPLSQVAPAPDGSFTTTVDVASLSPGATTWTVNAWDSSPGQAFNNTATITLDLTIGSSAASCAGQTCSGHGTCSEGGGQVSCSCDAGFHGVGLSCLADSTGNDGAPDPGTAYVPAGYHLAFSDEFGSGPLDTGKWNTLAPYGVQFYADSHQKQAFIPDAVSISNGIVTFTASHSAGNTNGQPYASGSITTNRTFTYGYFEARVKVPAGKGLWPAFWLTSSSRWPPEWDIFEIIDSVIFGYTHPAGGKCSFVDGAAGSDSTYMLPNVYGTYHVYGFKWTGSDLYWYVDGVTTEHYAVDAAAGAGDPFWLNLMMQVGGDWPGDPDGTTPLPAHMDVDYVRVYEQ